MLSYKFLSMTTFINGLFSRTDMGIGHKKPQLVHRGRHRAKRPRTFKTEENAKKWADSQGIKKYDVVRLSDGLSKKLKIVPK